MHTYYLFHCVYQDQCGLTAVTAILASCGAAVRICYCISLPPLLFVWFVGNMLTGWKAAHCSSEDIL